MKVFRQNHLHIGDSEELMFEATPGNKEGDKTNTITIYYLKNNKVQADIWLDKDKIQDIIDELEYWKSKL